jgi:4-hydroxy-2-oxoheptanedioate aldolase
MTNMPPNPFKQALREGRQQLGLWCSIPDSGVAEMLAGCGYDWILVDTEHSPMDPVTILPLLQAMAPYPVHTIVRPTSLNAAEIKKVLDVGAQTILVPYVQSADEARLAAAAVDYPPGGIRGVAGITRASRYGTVRDYHRNARDGICLLLQVETAQALDALEDIAAVPGVDGIFIGPADIGASLGYPGEPGHPEVKARVLDGIRRIRAAGKPAGVLTLDQEFTAECVEAGTLFTAVDVDAAILRNGAAARAAEWRARIGGK